MLLLLLFLIPQLAMARVYMCVDEASGQTTFTDKGCHTSAKQAEVRVPASNVDSGANTAEEPEQQTWVSDRDTRKTGRDYSAERRRLAQGSTTASIDTEASYGGI